MASRDPVFAALALFVALPACKAPEARSPDAPHAEPSESAPGAEHAPSDGLVAPGTPPTREATPPSGAEPVPGAPPAADERPGPPLPELRVKSFGLHVGGAAKDEEQRRAAQRALERGFPRFLDCYRLVEQPGVEGTFGADLRVEVDGGRPAVSRPRTALRGDAFRACMIRAFESTRFEAPSIGRVLVVSYSVKFSFAW